MNVTGMFRFTLRSHVVCVLMLQLSLSTEMNWLFLIMFRNFNFNSQLSIKGLALAHRFFSPVVRLAKRWVHAHLFSNHLRGNTTIETQSSLSSERSPCSSNMYTATSPAQWRTKYTTQNFVYFFSWYYANPTCNSRSSWVVSSELVHQSRAVHEAVQRSRGLSQISATTRTFSGLLLECYCYAKYVVG